MDRSAEPELVIDGGEPVSRQIEGQIRRHILGGVLLPGEKLPTVRAVAVGLAVNPNAVEEAYGRLEREGLLSLGEGCGPRVTAPPEGDAPDELDNLCRDFLRRTSAEGYAPAAVLQSLQAWIDRGCDRGEPS